MSADKYLAHHLLGVLGFSLLSMK